MVSWGIFVEKRRKMLLSVRILNVTGSNHGDLLSQPWNRRRNGVFAWIPLLFAWAAVSHAGVFAEYRTDFQGPVPHTGWRYMWNAPTDWDTNQVPPNPKSQNGGIGAIGETNCYVQMNWTGRWNVDTNQSTPNDSSPGRYLYLGSADGHPGRGSAQPDTAVADGTATQPLPPAGPNTLDRYPIAAYTIQPGETGAVYIVNSWLTMNNGGRGGGDTLVVRVYVNSTFKYLVKQTGNVNRTVKFDGVLGVLGTNDTVFVAVGPDGSDSADGFNWNFCLSNVPESTNGNIRVADFRDDYQSGTNTGALAVLSNGWSYLWNAPSDWNGTSSANGLTGPIDSLNDYELLKWNGGSLWTADGDADNNNGVPANYLQMNGSSGHPGRGYSQKETITNDCDRYVISAFQVDIAGYYILHDSWFTTSGSEPNGNEVRVYTSNSPSNPILSTVFMAVASASFNTKLGYLNAGDTVYVAVGPSVTDGSDSYGIDYSLSLERRAIDLSSSCITGLAGTNARASVVFSSPDGIVTNADVTLFWKAAGESFWSGSNSLGAAGVGSLMNVSMTGLARNTTYYYAFYGVNSLTNAEAWSVTNCFTTFDSRDYVFRQQITFNGYTGSEQLTNFPALVVFNEGLLRFYHREFSSGAGDDLRFINSNLTAVLNHEIEQWDTNGTSYVWVQVPVLASNTAIWAYWGSTNAATAQVYTTNGSTWSANYAGVWHFRRDGGGVEDPGDSSGHDLSGIPTNDPVSISGRVGYGVDFNGTSDGFLINSTSLRATGVNFAQATVSWWALTRFQPVSNNWWELSVPGGEFVAELTDNNSCSLYDVNSDISGATNVTVNTPDVRLSWHYFAATMSKPGNVARLYLDGALLSSSPWSAASAIENFSIGFALQRTGRYMNASLDEMRLSKVPRSADWLNACYLNQGANGSFSIYDRVDAYGLRGGTAIMVK